MRRFYGKLVNRLQLNFRHPNRIFLSNGKHPRLPFSGGLFASPGNWGEDRGHIDFLQQPNTKWPPRQRKKVFVRDDLHKFLPSMLSLHPTVFNGKIYDTFINITDFLITLRSACISDHRLGTRGDFSFLKKKLPRKLI